MKTPEWLTPKKNKIAFITACSLLIVLLFISFVLPIIARNKAIEAIQQSTGRNASIKSVTINPLTLTVAVHQLAIQDKDGGPFVSIGRVKASLGLASIHRRALILATLDINDPSFSFARTAPNQFSFSDIIERQKADVKPKKSGESRFSINNISITNGYVDFFDKAIEKGRKHTVRNLEIKVPFISNIPYLVEKYTDPKLSAEINGAAFNFDGKLKPLSKSLETSVNINLKQLNLPELVAYSPVKPPAELKSGKLTINTDVSYRVSSDKKPELNIKGLIKLSDVVADMPNGQPLIRLPELAVGTRQLEVFAKVFEFDLIKFDRLEVFVNRDAKGQWTHDLLLPRSKADSKETPAPAKAETKTGETAPKVNVTQLQINDSSVHFSDSLPKGGFKSSLSKINFKLDNFSNAADKNALYQLGMLIDDASFKSTGQFSVTPLSAKTNLELTGLKLQKGWPYLSQFLTAPVNGTLDLSSDVAYAKENGLSTSNGNLIVKNISTRFNKSDGFDLALLSINGTSFNQKENSLLVNTIQISKGNLNFSRDKDGVLSPLALLVSKQSQTAQGTAQTAANTPKATPTRTSDKGTTELKYSLKQLQLDKFNVAFTDRAKESVPEFKLRNTNLSLNNFNGPKFTPAQMTFSTVFGNKSPIKAAGLITPQPFRYVGNLNISQLQISDFEDYFPDNLNVEVLSGGIDTKLKLDIALKDGKPTGKFSGSSGIRSFHSIDSISEEDLLKWESLQFDNFEGRLEPFSLNINQIALNNFYSRIVVRKNGTLNLQNLVDKPTPEAETKVKAPESKTSEITAPQTAATGTAPVQPQKTAARGEIKVGAITLQGGTLNFTDNHLPQHFTTTFFNLGGRVSGLSSEEVQMADVDLRGNLENHSPLQITGKINPLRDDLFIDLTVSFKDIELSPVTPYTGTFLGYTVEKGKLFLDLKYHIEKKELNSDNKIFIDQFTFGNKVESDKATNLPVKLGLALLKDRKGEIHLDVPVTGRTDDPKFSIWKLVFQVLRNLLVKAATSPFSLLSSMFGGGEDLSTVQFAYGTSSLKQQEELKLNALSKALADRPALKLELKAYVDGARDAESYKSELLDRKIRNEKYLALAKGQQATAGSAESVKVLPEEYSTYLKAVYKKEKFPKPRNIIGLVKDLPDSEMKKLIITNTVVGNNELRVLAQERNNAVMNYLVTKGGIDSKRVFQKIDDILKKPEKEGVPGSRVELNAVAQ